MRLSTRDRYGRTVARVICAGADANVEQVRAGMAWTYTKYQTNPQFTKHEQQARAARVGLWRDANPVAPWEWRADRRQAR
ncbi:MAG: nuclease [Alcaligenaceae bacterium]|nr:MAG: nuclease [Alcaligenaceae bacterium]